MLNQMQHLTRIYMATSTTDDAFQLDELVIKASAARSTYIKHYLQLEQLDLDETEKQHLDLINQQAGKIRIAQLAYDEMLENGIPLEQRLKLAVDNIITPQNTTQALMQDFVSYIRDKTISDSTQYQSQNRSGIYNLEQLQIITLYLTLFLSIFSVYVVFKGQKTINDKNHALSQAESFLHSAINSTPIALVITDKEGQIIMVNNKAEQVFGYTRPELMALNISELIPENLRAPHIQHMKNYVKNPASREMYTGLEITAVRHSGEVFPVEVGLSPVDGQDELFIACSIKDISEQKAMEKEILESKNQAETANQAKSDFLANVSHELRTPLHAILSFSRLGLKNAQRLPDESRAGNKMRNYFNKIQVSGDKLLSFINDLLDSAKFESGTVDLDFAPYDLMDAILSCKNEQEARLQELKLKLVIDEPDSEYLIECDKYRINQVINNLIANAIKYSPKNSRILIRMTKDVLHPETDLAENAIRFTIMDEGPGVPEEDLDYIFQKFIQSTKSASGGTGLGLSLCHDIIMAHRGRIWASNRKPTGAVFSFIIPTSQPD